METKTLSLERAKATLRESVLRRREAMDPADRAARSRDITHGISGLESYLGSDVVLAYVGFGSELRTDDFLRLTLELGKTLILPRGNRAVGRLDIYAVEDPASDLKPGTWGIREPDPGLCAPADLRSVDFVLVPGVAFDARGGRLGYGAGFYDRLLAGRHPGTHLVAGAFEVQIVERIPMAAHDVPVDLVVTEDAAYPPA